MKKMTLAAAAVAAAAFAFAAQAQDDSTHRKVTVTHKTTIIRHTRTGPAEPNDRRVVHRRIVRHRIVHRRIVHRMVRHDAMNDQHQNGDKRVVTTRTTRKVVVRHDGN
jgi:hypothetical protein